MDVIDDAAKKMDVGVNAASPVERDMIKNELRIHEDLNKRVEDLRKCVTAQPSLRHSLMLVRV